MVRIGAVRGNGVKDENAIEVKNLKKSFKVYYDKGKSLKEKAIFWKRNRYETREVLKGISFEVKKGEAIGLIGHNGCGKSTTLKLLTKIIYPDEGTIEMRGRVVSLIELGAGFHPDMSGRENIYTNAAIFGLTKTEIDARIDDIIEFSELEEFIDNPVRTYSSGMYMRLAFAVAINVDADILLIDEILAVGDAGFQTKCFKRLKETKEKGTTIVIVSHAMEQIKQICNRCLWLHEGYIKVEDDPVDAIPQYMSYMAKERKEIERREAKEHNLEDENEELNNDEEILIEGEKKRIRVGSGEARFTKVTILDKADREADFFYTGEPFHIHFEYEVKRPVEDAVIGFGIFRRDGVEVVGTNTRIDLFENYDLKESGSVDITIPQLNLIAGEYWLDSAIEHGAGIPVDYWRRIIRFEVFNEKGEAGICRMEHDWKFSDQSLGKKLA